MPSGVFNNPEERGRKISIAKKGKKRPDLAGKWINEKSPCWKGDSISYRGLHRWVEGKLGKPRHCAHCQREDAKVYDWANISHSYKRDLSDWVRLCRSCHINYDLGKIVL
jgi:hypothetical protein